MSTSSNTSPKKKPEVADEPPGHRDVAATPQGGAGSLGRPGGPLRSQQWFGRQDRDGFAYRSWVKGKGVPHDQFDGRPVIGICNT